MGREALIHKIFESLGDELSKKIFEYRLQYSILKDRSDINEMLTVCWDYWRDNKQIVKIAEMLKHNRKKLFLFGAGNYTRLLLYFFPDYRWRIIDNNKKKDNYYGAAVINFEDFLKEKEDSLVFIASKKYYQKMKEQLLKEANYSQENIIDVTFLFNLVEGYQYFDLECLQPVDNEIFVDGGCFDGKTSINFWDWCRGKCKKIYGFEPDKKNWENIKKNIYEKEIENFTIIKKGLWDSEQRLKFFSLENGMSKIHDSDNTGSAGYEIEVTSLDKELAEVSVTFLKLDIEGAELKALYGAENLIRKNRPRLAICVYHRLDDIITIPEYVLSIHPDYKLYFRHYGFTESETVMYAL